MTAAPTQLGYIGIGARDVAAWEDFGTLVLGLESGGREADGSLLLRMDDHSYRFIVTEDKVDDLNLIGWEVKDEPSLAELAHALESAGYEIRPGDEETREKRRVVDLIQFTDPDGVDSEAFFGPLLSRDQPFRSPRSVGSFLAGDQGLGHIVMAVKSRKDSLHFYRDILGLRLSDWVHPQGDVSRTLTFMRCNARHHSLAFLEVEMPKRLHHFLLQVGRVDDVGATHDLCVDRDIPIVIGLGRHTNDGMLSFYMETPSGFAVEYGWGATEVDERTWQVQQHLSGSVWGHRR